MKSFLLVLPVLFLSACAATSQPPKLSEVKNTLYAYHDSGAYDRDVSAAFAQAAQYIEANSNAAKPAIVLDIDETSLSNWEELKANELTFKLKGPCRNLPEGPCGLDAYHQLGISPSIPPALALFNKAKQNDIAVFFITGRREFLRQSTARNLKAAGYKNWNGLVLRPVEDKNPSAIPYKSAARAKIESQGYTIIAAIGDQASDLTGGHTGKTFLIPNPFYTLK